MVEDELFDRYISSKTDHAKTPERIKFRVFADKHLALATDGLSDPQKGAFYNRVITLATKHELMEETVLGHYVTDPERLKTVVALDSAYSRLTDKNVRFSRQDVLKVLAEEGMKYGFDVDRIEQLNREIYETGELVKLGLDEKKQPIYSTKTMIGIEKSLQEKVAAGVADHRHHVPRRIVQDEIDKFHKGKDWRLSGQQVESVLKITEGSGRISTINGSAGAGKSTSMNIVKQVYDRQGYELIGCAIAGKAAAELQDGSGIKSQTIDSLLIELENGKRQLSEKTIIVMDEAGMVGSAQMNRILELTEKAAKEGKVIHTVLLGDTEQLQPVSAGPAFKLAQEELHRQGQETAVLDEIRRQKDEWGRTAAHDFSAGRAAEGLAEYYARDKIRFYEATEEGAKPADHRFAAIEGAVAAWQADLSRYELSQNQMIALTNADVYTANFIAHEELKRAGAIGTNGHQVETAFGEREFVLGDRVIFRENENKKLNVKNGWTATITDISTTRDGATTISVLCDNGEKRTFSTADYNKLDWSYAITTHASQGITKENTHILAGGSMTDLSSFYVQMSRHKEDATIHIDHNSVHDIMLDAEPTERMTEYAEELAEKKEIELPNAYETDFWTCRDFLNEHSPKQYEAKGDALDSEMSSKEIETLGMLAELASRDRKKESTLDYLGNETGEGKIKQQTEEDPRSKLTMKERLQLAVRVKHDREYDPESSELPDFDQYEAKIIRRNASDKIYESMGTDKPLTQTEAYKESARDWMAIRVHERKSLVHQEAARELLASKQQATKQQATKQQAALTQ
jgi:Ti-type conjugative transfer relaxase TraA